MVVKNVVFLTKIYNFKFIMGNLYLKKCDRQKWIGISEKTLIFDRHNIHE